MTRAAGPAVTPRSIDAPTVLDALARMEVSHRNTAWAAVAGGAGLSLAVVLGIAVLYCTFSGFSTIGGWGFTVTYLVMAVVFLPILFLLAAKFQQGPPDPSGGGGTMLTTASLEDDDTPPLHKLADRANAGPRYVLWGVDQLRHERSAFGAVSHERVAAALLTLVTADGGVSPAKLVLPGESADHLEPVLAVLLHHDLTGLSKAGDRIWITTAAKRKLGMPV